MRSLAAESSAIILAAGLGNRLGQGKPKGLVPVAGRPMIEYGIHFLRDVGFKEIIIVGGFFFDELERAVREINADVVVVRNEQYVLGNIFSLEAGLRVMTSKSFLLFHGDHLYPKSLVPVVREACVDDILMFTDTDRILTNDDMKIALRDGACIDQLSKKIDIFSHGYVGLSFIGPTKFPRYKETLERVVADVGDTAVTENIVQDLANRGECIGIADISGYGWYEIDFPEELQKATQEIGQNKQAFI